jgi:hypothetical protein
MLGKQHNSHLSMAGRIVGSICIAVILALVCATSTTQASSVASTANQLSLQVNVGLGSQARIGYWLPVWVTVKNAGRQDFSGTVSLRIYSGLYRPGTDDIVSQQRFEQTVTVPHGQQKQVMLHTPFNVGSFNVHGVLAELLDPHGKVVVYQEHRIDPLNSAQISVGVLSDDGASLNYLSNLSLPNQATSLQVIHLKASSFPTTSAELENFDVLIVDNFTSSTLNAAQRSALQTWVNQGGAFIEVGGPSWKRTLSPLPPDLLAVDVYTTIDLASGSRLLPAASQLPATSGQRLPPDTINAPLQVSFATPATRDEKGQGAALKGNVVEAFGITPLIVTASEGQGTICYLAFDPASAPFLSWGGTNALWMQIFLRSVGDPLLISPLAPRSSSGPGNLNVRGGVLSMLQNNVWITPWVLLLMIFGYITILGPARFLLVRRLRRPFWNWRLMLSSVLVFSLLTYGVAFYQKGSSLTDNSVSVVQINQDSSAASITTYMGVFVPNEGDFHVQFPTGNLAQAVPLPLISSNAFMISGDSSTPVTYGPRGTDVALLDSGLWTFHSLVAEQDRQLHGTISTNLTIQRNRLVGTIKNTLTPLSDVYILLPYGFVSIGTLPAGETQKIDLALQPSSSDTPLADQLAQNGGLPAAYFPYTKGDLPQTDFQRHMALLSALNGNGASLPPCGGPCNGNAIVNTSKHTVTSLRPGLPSVPWTSANDPLLLDGAQATMIGWADQPLDNMQMTAVNGSIPTGTHENFVQMPLNVGTDLSSSLSTDLIQGQAVATTGYDNEMVLPGVYMMDQGSMNFEFNIAAYQSSHIKGLEINLPNVQQNEMLMEGQSYVQTALYNWQSGAWDKVELNHYSLTLSNFQAYVGPNSQILLRVTNPATAQSQSDVIFKRPALNLVV